MNAKLEPIKLKEAWRSRPWMLSVPPTLSGTGKPAAPKKRLAPDALYARKWNLFLQNAIAESQSGSAT